MSKKSFSPEQCIGPLNNVKTGMQMTERPFSKDSLINGFKGCGLPTNNAFWGIFRNSGIIQEVSKGQFMFTSKDPIYVGVLTSIKHKYQELVRRYNGKRTKTEKPEEVPKAQVPENDPMAMTQFAIDLLKEQGYQIFAPIGVIYQQL